MRYLQVAFGMNLRYYSRNHSHAANENLLVILNVNKWPHMDAYSEPYHTPKRELKVVFGKNSILDVWQSSVTILPNELDFQNWLFFLLATHAKK